MTTGELLRALAGWRLPGCHLALPAAPLGPDAWDELLTGVVLERVRGLLAATIACGEFAATDEQAESAELGHRQAMDGVLELEAMAVRAAADLTAAGVEVRLLKGLAIAHRDETDPSLRCFNDVDLLVPPDRLPEAIAALTAAGYRRDLPERRPGFDLRFAKEATMAGPTGREVDLHRTLALGAFGLAIDLGELWAGSDRVTLAGRSFCALDPELRLLHACYAAVLADPTPRLVLLRDIGLLVNKPDVDLDRVLALARSWRAEAVLATGLRFAGDAFGVESWPRLGWARAYRPRGWSRRALSAYDSHGGSNTRVLLSGALAPIGLGSRAAYLRAMVLPSRAYVAARRQAGRPNEFRAGLRELVRRRPG